MIGTSRKGRKSQIFHENEVLVDFSHQPSDKYLKMLHGSTHWHTSAQVLLSKPSSHRLNSAFTTTTKVPLQVRSYDNLLAENLMLHIPKDKNTYQPLEASAGSKKHLSCSRQSSQANHSTERETELIKRSKQKWYDIFHYSFENAKLKKLFQGVSKNFKYLDMCDMLETGKTESFLSKILSMFVMVLDSFNDNLSLVFSENKKQDRYYRNIEFSPKKAPAPSFSYLESQPNHHHQRKTPLRIERKGLIKEAFGGKDNSQSELQATYYKQSRTEANPAPKIGAKKFGFLLKREYRGEDVPTKSKSSPKTMPVKRDISQLLNPNTYALPIQPHVVAAPRSEVKLPSRLESAKKGEKSGQSTVDNFKKPVNWMDVFKKSNADDQDLSNDGSSIRTAPRKSVVQSFSGDLNDNKINIEDLSKKKSSKEKESQQKQDLLAFLEGFRKNKPVLVPPQLEHSPTMKSENMILSGTKKQTIGSPKAFAKSKLELS
jgi:hypothetical protein